MSFQNFSDFVFAEKAKFEEKVSEKAKTITLRDIITEVDSVLPWNEGFDYVTRKESFEMGNELKYSICYHGCEVRINPNKLSFEAFHISTRTFSGIEVENYYNKLATKVLESQQEYLKNLPF